MTWQDFAAIGIAVVAFLYVVSKLTGWPRRPEGKPKVLVGDRLQRGLEKANREK